MKKTLFIISILIIAIIILQACKNKSEDPIPATTTSKDKYWAVDPNFTGNTDTLTKEKNPTDANTLSLSSEYDPGFTSVPTVIKGKPLYSPDFFDKFVGSYSVEDDKGVYSFNIKKSTFSSGTIQGFERKYNFDIQNGFDPDKKTFYGYLNDGQVKINIFDWSYANVDGSLLIDYTINGERKRITAYLNWLPQ